MKVSQRQVADLPRIGWLSHRSGVSTLDGTRRVKYVNTVIRGDNSYPVATAAGTDSGSRVALTGQYLL